MNVLKHGLNISRGTNGANQEVFQAQAQDGKPNTDPVIQMLATRAASNHELKALMKVVASGDASQTQLKDFQNHIDDLNKLIKSQNDSVHNNIDRRLPPMHPSSERVSADHSLISKSTLSMGHLRNPMLNHPPEPVKYEPRTLNFSHYPQQSAKPKSMTTPKSDIIAVVFHLGGIGDRFSFPRFSILEYLPGGTQVIVSFLIIRKGSGAGAGATTTIAAKGYKDTASYYQPVTMRLSSLQPRVLEPLARVVAPPDEVRRYMNSIFDKMSPAENAFLVTRLPRVLDEPVMENDEQPELANQSLIQPVYPAPSARVPLIA